MTAAPIPALRALPAGVLSDLALGLRSGRFAAGASRFMIRYAFPDIGEPGAAELAALFENGLGFEHGAAARGCRGRAGAGIGIDKN